METNGYESEHDVNHTGQSHHKAVVALAIGLAVALAGDGYLLVRSNRLNENIDRTQNSAQTQISKLNEATTTLLQQEQARLDQLAEQVKQDMKGVSDSAGVAIRRRPSASLS